MQQMMDSQACQCRPQKVFTLFTALLASWASRLLLLLPLLLPLPVSAKFMCMPSTRNCQTASLRAWLIQQQVCMLDDAAWACRHAEMHSREVGALSESLCALGEAPGGGGGLFTASPQKVVSKMFCG